MRSDSIDSSTAHSLGVDRWLHRRVIALVGVAVLSGIFLRWLPFDYVFWYDLIGQLALATVIALFWRRSSLARKISLLVFGFFVGWLADWVVNVIRFQLDDWVAMRAGFVLLGVRSVFGFVFLLAFHFCLPPSLRREVDEPTRIIE